MASWVVAYDFSDLARGALSYAADMLSREGGGHLLVLHAHPIEPTLSSSTADGLAVVPSVPLDQAYVDDAERQLAEEIQTVSAPGVTLDHKVVIGWPAGMIASTAEACQADLIVVGTHGRRGLERMFLGSVAEAIIRRASCPVLVVKPSASAAPA